jgi:SagB-type dehydrogenase family enzyme
LRLRFKENVKLGSKIRFVIIIIALFITFPLFINEIIPRQVSGEQLPPVDIVGNIALSAAIENVDLSRDLISHNLEMSEISQLLWSLQGLTHGPGFRTAPSGGAIYPLEIYIYHRGTTTLRAGNYIYHPETHRIERVADVDTDLFSAPDLQGDKELLSNVSSIFFIMADYGRTTGRYGDAAAKFVDVEAGHALQNFFLESTALNLSTWPITAFDSNKVQSNLASNFSPIIILPVGFKPDLDDQDTQASSISDLNSNSMTVEQAIYRRRSTRDYIDGEIPRDVLLSLLDNSSFVSYVYGDPSVLNTQVVVDRVDGLNKGKYFYDLDTKKLTLTDTDDIRTSLQAASNNQQMVTAAQVNICISLNTTWFTQNPINQSLGQRLALLNLGMMAQNLYLKTTGMGLGMVVMGGIDPDAVRSTLDIKDTMEPVYVVPIGLTTPYNIQFTVLGALLGILTFGPMLGNTYLSIPRIHKYLRRGKSRYIHYILGSIAFISAVLHYIMVHGQVRNELDLLNPLSYINSIVHFVSNLSYIPNSILTAGDLPAKLAILSLGIISVLGLLMTMDSMLKYRRYLNKIHRQAIWFVLVPLLAHVVLNATLIATIMLLFTYLNVLLVLGYYLILIVPKTFIIERKTNV